MTTTQSHANGISNGKTGPASGPPKSRRRGADSSEFCHNGTISKVERYKWANVDAPGELKFIPKHLLQVDHDYQRDVHTYKVQEIAAQFSWPAFGVLIVAARSDGTMWVVEGQHRWQAAMRRADITKVPCIVFESDGLKAEAQTFLDANSKRKPVSALDKFRALLVTNDAAAVLVSSLIEKSNRKVGQSSAHGVACVKLLCTLANKHRDVLVRLWPIIVDASAGRPIHQELVEALVYIELHLADDTSLAEPRWSKRIVRIGATDLVDAAKRSAVMYRKGGARIWAEGILIPLNKSIGESRQLVLQRA